jgi:hypothetical protein
MNKEEARALLFQRKLTEVPVTISLPGLEALDNQLSVLELGADQMQHASKLAEGPNGESDNQLTMAAMICKSLVLRETKERLLNDLDFEAVTAWGTTVLLPLSKLVSQASGLGEDALEAAKKNSVTIPVSISATSSLVNSAEGLPSQS